MNIAIITGASSGMGRDFARILAEREHPDEIWLIARRAERLQELADELSGKCRCRTLEFDLKSDEAAGKIGKLVAESGASISFLVNAAGFGHIGLAQDIEASAQLSMIDVNCRALTALTLALLPYMASDSHIVMFSSAASFMAQPRFAVYAATKSYVQSFSRALNQELRPRKIHVLAVCPGPVKTEFFELAEQTGKMSIKKEPFMTDSKSVVKGTYRAAKRGAAMYTPAFAMKTARFLTKILPRSLIIRFWK